MELLFWLVTGAIVYTFLGYPVLVTLLSRYWNRTVRTASIEPAVDLVIPAYNEEKVMAAKIENSLALDYPAGLLRIFVVADGSDDGTTAICEQFPEVRLLWQAERRGKTAALHRALPMLEGEVVVFSDANAMLEAGSLRALVKNFADPQVAAVAGEKRVSAGGEGLYWRYESHLKKCDSRLGSVMGAAGELFAVRHDLLRLPPEDTLLEDFTISMGLVGDGWRVVYEPEAVAWEEAPPDLASEWQRRARNSAGGLQAIGRLPQMLDPRLGLASWQYFSHRVMRWAVTPFAIPLAFALNWRLRRRPSYRLPWFGQLLFYSLGLVGFLRTRQGRRGGLAYVIFFFCFTNLAALAGFWRFVTGRQSVVWKKTRR